MEKAIDVELSDVLIGRNLVSRIFRFPNNAWSYWYRQRSHTRATVLTEHSAPPVVRVGMRKFGMEYAEIGVAAGINDRMLRFGDIPAMEMATDAAVRALALKQDRDIFNCMIASVPYYADGSTPIYARLQNADILLGEWRTFELEDDESNRCSKQRSHVIVGDGNDTASQTQAGAAEYPTPPEPVDGTDENLALLIETLHLAIELIEEHPDGGNDLVLIINPKQRTDFRNLVDFSGSNKPSIPPPQFNEIMTRGWAGNWEGINIISNHAMTPGTALLVDRGKYSVLGEYGAPFITTDVRDEWLGLTHSIYRWYYCPACHNTDYAVLLLNLLGDTDTSGDPCVHSTKSVVDAQYTGLPMNAGERAGVPG